MTKGQFTEHLIHVLRESYEPKGWQVDSDIFLKNNDTARHGILFHPPEGVITPTIYIDHYYIDFLNKKSTLSEIANEIQTHMAKIEEQARHYETLAVDYDSCRRKIFFRLVSLKRNRQILRDSPYMPFLDLAITFHVVCRTSQKGIESMRVTNQLMENWQVGVKELMALAQENTPVLFPGRTESLHSMIADFLSVKEKEGQKEECPEKMDQEETAVLIVTNRQGINGATVLLYKNFIREIADRRNCNYYIIPSSIHELILLPDSSCHITLQELAEMIQEINQTHVHDDEVLSDHAYYYDRNENQFCF